MMLEKGRKIMKMYHVSKKTGKPEECRAVKRNCEYGEKYNSLREAQAAALGAVRTKLAEENYKQPEPVIVEVTKLTYPKFFTTTASEYYGPVRFEYDYYGPPFGEEPVEYNRNYQYDGLRLETVDIRGVLAEVYSCEPEEVPDSFVAEVTEKGWAETYSWDVHPVGGYYGEEVSLDPPGGFMQHVQRMYWSLPNATDENKILPYVRSKGTVTEGLAPLEALKKQLASENNNVVPDRVANATEIAVKNIKYDDVHVGNLRHYNEIYPRQPFSVSAESSAFIGVLVEQNGKLSIVDGYHRLKHERERRSEKGKFIILK